MSEMIRADSLTYRYTDLSHTTHVALDGVNLHIPYGQFAAILGRNGSGKSTFARHCNAIALPSGGQVWVDGIDTMDADRLWDIRRACSMVFQNPDNQIVATLVEEDVAFALENLGVPPEEIRRRVDEALKKVGMYEYRLHAPDQLSGGQKQRVAIAGIIAMQPRCVVLDEPTAMLDPKGRREVMSTIKQLNEEMGVTVVLITHYMDEAAQCGRVVVIDDGKTILDGTPREVFKNVELLKKRGLDVPQVTELCYELRKEGCKLPDCVLTEDECTAAIENLLKGGAQNG